MASTGVLPFIRGIDLSKNDFSADHFPIQMAEMQGLRWLKLNGTNLDKVPEQLSNLKFLEQLHMNRNNLTSVHGELSDLPNLRSIVIRKNQVKTSGIPDDVFQMQDLTIIDFSHNQLREVPSKLENAKQCIVLNLSHNNIETIPNQLFVNMTDLIHCDLSHNRIQMLPPQMRRVQDLQVLVLSENPLQHFIFKQVISLTALRVLHMRNVQMTLMNKPPSLETLVFLEDIDFSVNSLPVVPESLFKIKTLKRLNLADNQIASLDCSEPDENMWPKLEFLNVSRNELKTLPAYISDCTKLKKLFINDNMIDFEGLPGGLGRLVALEVFHAAHNKLELVPEGLCRCVKLRKLKLNHNRLVTLPGSIHLLSDLADIDLKDNPDLVMPPKPSEMQRGAGLAFYNIDFSLDAQLKLASGHQSPSSSAMSISPTPSRDPVARKIQFLKQRKGRIAAAEADSDQRKILQGMTEVAKERTKAEVAMEENLKDTKPNRWDEQLEKQKRPLDYSEFFDEITGSEPGLTVWEIENFLPNPMDELFHGKFYEGDCYIILKTYLKDAHTLDHQIFFWIGEKATLDKKACAAIHAVNLRNYLGAACRTQREEMNDESDEFLELFPDDIVFIEGGRTMSGFFTVEAVNHPTRLFRVSPRGAHIHLEPVEVSVDSLDPRFVFLLDMGKHMIVWYGTKSKTVLRSKARLYAEKVNKNERKAECEIDMVHQGLEVEQFWTALLGHDGLPDGPVLEHVPADFTPPRPILYMVNLGMGYLELPQVEYKPGQLKQAVLKTRCVYILDCVSDLFVWVGKQSTRLVRAAGLKIAAEVHTILHRPLYAQTHRECEGTESMLFKSKFFNWDDVIAVDFTRTADSVQRRGVDLTKILEKDKMKTNLTSLFLERQREMPESEVDLMMQECNEDLEQMEPFVLEGKKFVRLPEHEFGSFFTTDCYVFLCRYWMPSEGDYDEEGNPIDKEPDAAGEDDASESAAAPSDDFQCVVYFWQGRDASNMGWLTFTFSLQKKFEALFKDKLEVVRMYQQQENQKFLSHFKKKFIIKRGRRSLGFLGGRKYPEFYHVRANGSSINTRTIQIECDARSLCSAFCFILKVPYRMPDDDGICGTVFVWRGRNAKECEVQLAIEMSHDPNLNINRDQYPVETIDEGEEPELFWQHLKNSSFKYDVTADYLHFSRLFKCSNSKGYYCVSEKTIDFCQDDLDDDDIMLLDSGDELFIWVGSKGSEVEIKLTYKAAQTFHQHLRLKQPDRPRKLVATFKGRESRKFTRCFHAWSKHRTAPE